MNTILAVTLARGGSKGVPHKHTRLLCGKPVLGYTIEAVQHSKYLTDYVISSDDDEILYVARTYGVHTIRRPKELALDTTPTLPALQHAVAEYEALFHARYDYIVEVRATSPLKLAEDIDGVIETLWQDDSTQSAIGVTELEDHHPSRAKWMDVNFYLRDFVAEPVSGRRQDLEPRAFVRNGTVYAFRRDALMGEDGKVFGHALSKGYIIPAERSINIDTELDYELCKVLMRGR